jgi:ubiquinone/menaquinone biosynthesis C-methylase UbiE
MQRWRSRQSRAYDFIADLLVELPGDRVLDIGCGDGAGTAHLAERLGTTRVTGLDVDPKTLPSTRQGDDGRTTCLLAQAQELPFTEGVYDAVTCVMAFHHLREPTRVLAEAARVLKSGGRLIIADVDRDHILGRPFEWTEHLFIDRQSRAYQETEYTAMLEKAGFARAVAHRRGDKSSSFVFYLEARRT